MSTLVAPEALSERPAKHRLGAAFSFLERIPTQHALNMAVLMLFPLMLAQPMRKPSELLDDPDIWWHLANARNLFSSMHFVRLEPFSFSVAGQPWISPEWLSEIPYWFGFKWFHFVGIFL